jgi:hypothetical protein
MLGGAGSSNGMSNFNSGGFSSGMVFGPEEAVAGQSSGGTSGEGGGVGTVTDSMMMAAEVTFTGSAIGSGLGSFGALSSPVDFTGGFGGGTGALDLSSGATGTGFGTNVNAFGNAMNFGGGGGQGLNVFGTAGGMGAGAGTGAASGVGTTMDGVFSVTGTSSSDFNNVGQGFFGGGPVTLGWP